MKLLLTFIVAVCLSAACSRNEPTDKTEAQLAPTQEASPSPATGTAGAQQSASAAAPAAPPAASPPASAAPPRTAGPAAAPAATAPPATAPAATTTAPPPVAAAPPPAEPPPAPPVPKFVDVTIPAGTSLSVTVLSNLASNTSKVEDLVKGSLAKPLVMNGVSVLPSNAAMTGVVTEAKESGRVKGRATISIRFEQIAVRGETHKIQTAPVIQEAQAKKSDDVKKGGIGAGLGAVVGGIAGGGTGAAIGAVAGGTGAVLATKGGEVEVPAGTVVNVLVQEPFTVRVPLK